MPEQTAMLVRLDSTVTVPFVAASNTARDSGAKSREENLTAPFRHTRSFVESRAEAFVWRAGEKPQA
jgi:hypothetical protein